MALFLTVSDYANIFNVHRNTASKYYEADCKFFNVLRLTLNLIMKEYALTVDDLPKYLRNALKSPNTL